ncbi:putative duf167 domain protein [Erysiphe neolycopersici]|uniref:Putative duf167 domain protein n=1 Tax=Erysiphe neolycopersici TaxID=212602 RepID=A0A420I5H1_9PEZI|nr:putative duf167 domain protein [Erysiphe neolycopersici]
MAPPGVLRYAINSLKPELTCVQLRCHIKTGVAANRQGIHFVTDNLVTIGVFAKPKDGEANKAVIDIISQSLSWPRSDLQIIKGLKSQYKTVALMGITGVSNKEEYVAKLRNRLGRSSKSRLIPNQK